MCQIVRVRELIEAMEDTLESANPMPERLPVRAAYDQFPVMDELSENGELTTTESIAW